MHCEEYLSRSQLFRRLRSGPHGQHVERYAARLVGDELVPHGTWRCLNVVGGLLRWIASRRCVLAGLDERMVEQYVRHRATKQSVQPGDRSALKRWLSVLREEGAIIEAILATPDQTTWLGRRDHTLLLLAVQTGLRLSELISLDRGGRNGPRR